MRSKFVAWLCLTVAVVAGLLTFFIPATLAPKIAELAFHLTLLVSVPVAVLHVAAAGLFVWGLDGFKHELRVAYILICIGITLLGLAQLQTPLVSFYDLTISWYVTSGLVVIPFILPLVLLFAGAKRFVPLLQIKTRWASWWLVLGGTVVVSLAAVLLAWLVRGSDTQLLVSVGLATWASAMLCATAAAVLKTNAAIGQLYHSAFRWFAAANMVSALSGVTYVSSLILLGNDNVVSRDGGTLLPDLFAGLLFLRSGYAFKRINEQAVAKAMDVAKTTILDVIQYTAEQASNPAQIDPILDNMRTVTASMPAGEEPVLTPEQQQELQRTYASLEEYLVSKEPLRQFTPQTVRQKIAANFGLNDQQLSQIIGSAA